MTNLSVTIKSKKMIIKHHARKNIIDNNKINKLINQKDLLLNNKSDLYKLFNNINNEEINKLFKDISRLDINEIWKEQQYFKLAKQIYIASTTYGQDNSACIQGAWTQIIMTALEINPLLINNQKKNKKKFLILFLKMIKFLFGRLSRTQ